MKIFPKSARSFMTLPLLSIFAAVPLGNAHADSLGPVINCDSFWKAYPGIYYCREVKGFGDDVSSVKTRFFRYNDAATEVPATQQPFVDWTKTAVKDSLATYAPLGKLTDFSFVLVHEPHPETGAKYNVYGEAHPLQQGPGEACQVTIYPESLLLPEEKYKQMIAHELFHCFQGTNFHKQMSCSDGGTPDSCDKATVWWVEGTADFFSNLVYPTANFEFSHINSYDAKLPVQLQSYPYATAAFFQALANHAPDGVQAVLRLLRNMATTDKLSDHQSALSKNILMPENLHAFARDLVAGTIADTGGGYIPFPFNGTPQSIDFDPKLDKLSLKARPFTAKTAQILVPSGYKVTFGRLRGGVPGDTTARASVRRMGAPLWKDLSYLSAVEDYSCNGDNTDTTIEIVVTSARAEDQESQIDIPLEIVSKSCGCKPSDQVDPCMVGSWKLTNDILAQGVADLPKTTKLEATFGTMTVTIAKTQAYSMNLQGFGATYKVTNENTGEFEMLIDLEGLFKARLGVTSDGSTCLRERDDKTTTETTVTFPNSKPIVSKTSNALTGSENDDAGTMGTTISCTDSGLNMQYVLPGIGGPTVYNAIFKRN